MNDYESEHRFYHHVDVNKIPAHGSVMRIWMESMQLRFYLEFSCYIIMAVLWEYFMLNYDSIKSEITTIMPEITLDINSRKLRARKGVGGGVGGTKTNNSDDSTDNS